MDEGETVPVTPPRPPQAAPTNSGNPRVKKFSADADDLEMKENLETFLLSEAADDLLHEEVDERACIERDFFLMFCNEVYGAFTQLLMFEEIFFDESDCRYVLVAQECAELQEAVPEIEDASRTFLVFNEEHQRMLIAESREIEYRLASCCTKPSPWLFPGASSTEAIERGELSHRQWLVCEEAAEQQYMKTVKAYGVRKRALELLARETRERIILHEQQARLEYIEMNKILLNEYRENAAQRIQDVYRAFRLREKAKARCRKKRKGLLSSCIREIEAEFDFQVPNY